MDFSTLPLEICSAIVACLEVADVEHARASSFSMKHVCSSDGIWRTFATNHWKTKSMAATRRFRDGLSDECTSWRERYIQAELDGRRSRITQLELTSLTFDFRFRFHPTEPQSEDFRFGSSGHVSGHPNGLTYKWRLLEGGSYVQLGDFPRARVRRLASWGWALCNPNVVLLSLEEPGTGNSDDADYGPTHAASITSTSHRDQAAIVQENSEVFEPMDHDDGMVQVQLADGRTAIIPESVLRVLLAQQMRDSGDDSESSEGSKEVAAE